ncbi:hypothetical protein ACIQ9J_24425 [Streptomyces sp. NPDC094153]|uniref:hypothetical protein n=1 Tax=Streptomyces sp. NPDC094153 TaxID=3366058 RepID=UPI003822B041
MIEQVARRMAEQVVREAPEGWTRVVLSGHAGRGGSGILGGGYAVPGPRAPMGLPDVHSRLAELAGAIHGDAAGIPSDGPDLTVLADLADLRYLALGRQQWATLLDHGTVPPALAAISIVGDDVTYDVALALASRAGLDTGDALRVAGSL